MPRPQSPKSAPRGNSASPQDLLPLIARAAAGQGLTVLGELGRSADGVCAYLARDGASGSLVVVTATGTDPENTPDLSIRTALDDSIPGPRSLCPSCQNPVDGWIRQCSCGADLPGVAPRDEAEQHALTDRVVEATGGAYEILGWLPYTDDAGAAFFGRALDTPEMYALWLRHGIAFDDGTPRFTVTVSSSMKLAGASAEALTWLGVARPLNSDPPLRRSSMGSGLLAKQPTPQTLQAIAVPKVCPQCGGEYETGSRFCPNDGSPLRPKGSADPLIGRIIAERYIVLKRLGEGGMGRVYLAEHVKMNRQCAIKVMGAALVNDPESAKRFAREASSAARIIHPNVAAVFDYGEGDGLVYIVMEYVDGEPLTRVLQRERILAPHRALDIARQVLEGLAAAHELGIVHRDLKPDNILITRSRNGREVAKVVDFGIAKAMVAGEEDLTRTGLVIGTPEYMSPEQLLGDPVDARSDIYSLGCILFQMLTGTPTFEAPTREQMIKRRLTEEPPRPQQLNPEIPSPLDDVVHRMLTRSPDQRYASAVALHELLTPEAALEVHANPLHRPTPRSAPTLQMEAAEISGETPVRRRSGWRAWTLGGGAVAAVVLGAFAFFSHGRAPAAPVAAQSDSARRAAAPRPTVVPAGNILGAESSHTLARTAVASTGSTARSKTAHGASDSAKTLSKLTPDQEATHRVIDRYRAAIEAADTAAMRKAFPGIPPAQQQSFQKNFFDVAKMSRAALTYTSTAINGNKADVDFEMHLLYYRGGVKGSSRLVYHALLDRVGGAWVLRQVAWK